MLHVQVGRLPNVYVKLRGCENEENVENEEWHTLPYRQTDR